MIAAAAMIFSLASCSVNDIEKPGVADKTTAYAKVVISMPNVPGTRADFTSGEGDNTVDVGTEPERLVNSINLAFYDEYGTYVSSGSLASERKKNESGNVSDTYADIVKVTLPEGANKPTQVVAFINMPAETANLNDLRTNKTVTTDSYLGDQSGFKMTNAGYYDGENYVIAVPVTLYTTEDEAKANDPDDIYVERLAAKITVNDAENIKQNAVNYDINTVDGKSVKLKYTPKFWGATGTADKENVVKTKFTKSADWMVVGDHRSHWAEGVYYYGTGTDAENAKFTAEGPLKYLKFKEIAGTGTEQPAAMNAMKAANYVLEHTSPLGIDEMNLISNTYVIVTGSYEVSVEETKGNGNYVKDETVYVKGNQVDFYLLSTGMKNDRNQFTIYNEAELMEHVLGYCNGIDAVYSEEADGKEITVADLVNYFTLDYKKDDQNGGKYYLNLKKQEGSEELVTVYVKENGSFRKLESKDIERSTNSRHYYFPAGGAYFNVPIPQNLATKTYGVVRNHSYVLTITEIVNLGAPLDEAKFTTDPKNPGEDPVIPDPDDFQNYINAKINVLSWQMVSNNVVL